MKDFLMKNLRTFFFLILHKNNKTQSCLLPRDYEARFKNKTKLKLPLKIIFSDDFVDFLKGNLHVI